MKERAGRDGSGFGTFVHIQIAGRNQGPKCGDDDRLGGPNGDVEILDNRCFSAIHWGRANTPWPQALVTVQ